MKMVFTTSFRFYFFMLGPSSHLFHWTASFCPVRRLIKDGREDLSYLFIVARSKHPGGTARHQYLVCWLSEVDWHLGCRFSHLWKIASPSLVKEFTLCGLRDRSSLTRFSPFSFLLSFFCLRFVDVSRVEWRRIDRKTHWHFHRGLLELLKTFKFI